MSLINLNCYCVTCPWCSGEREVSWHRDRAASTPADHWISGLSYPRDTRAIPTRQHLYPRLLAQERCYNAAWTTQRCRQMS